MTRDPTGGPQSARPHVMWSVTAATALVVAVLLFGTACSSGALRGPASRSDDTSGRESTEASESGGSASGSTPSEQGGGPAPAVYGYSLPEGDTENADDNGVMYMFLAGSRCAEAQAYLDSVWAWGFQSPEEVLMFQVGTSMCAGDEATAVTQFDRGERFYGWAGLATFGRNLCNIYRAYLSHRDQRPQDAITCPGGRLVYWPGWMSGDPASEVRDDPRTDAVESASPHNPDLPPSTSAPDGTGAPSSQPAPSMPGEPTDTRSTESPSDSAAPGTTPTAGSMP